MRLRREGVHKFIIVRRVVMEEAKLFGAGLFRKTKAALPRRMAPPFAGLDLFFREHCVIDDEICVLCKRDELRIMLARKAFGVAQQCKHSATTFKPITARPVGMIELAGPQGDVVVWP